MLSKHWANISKIIFCESGRVFIQSELRVSRLCWLFGILNTSKHSVLATESVSALRPVIDSKGYSRGGASILSPEDRNKSSFRNVVSSSV
jgi:hypothetical protein